MAHIWNEVLDDCLKWHRETFSEDKCSHESQLLKLNEELKEMREALEKEKSFDNYIKEVVDVLIVSYVLSVRYEDEVGAFVFSEVEKNITLHWPELKPKIRDAIKEKLEVNKKRFWIFEDGKYHHMEEVKNALQ